MKKILVLFMMTFMLLPSTSTIAIATSNKSNFISKKTNIHKYQAPDPKIPHNEASINDYRYKKNTAMHLNISMTGDFYNRFFARITASPSLATKEYFIMMFTGDQEPYLSSEWKDVVKELKVAFIEEAKAKHIAVRNYFYNLFVNWLKSNSGWASFKAVFIGENLSNNTYKMPDGYNQAKAEEEFRRNGVILQFDFNILNPTLLTWKIDNICRIFPYTPSVIGLTYYYQDTDNSSGSEKKVPPTFGIDTSNPPPVSPFDTVAYLKSNIKEAIRESFHLPSWVIKNGLIRIPHGQEHIHITKFVHEPTPLIITFFNFDNIPYINKTINLYIRL